MKPLNKTNKEIEAMGGVFLKGWSEYSQMFGKYITSYIYLLNDEEVYSIIDWDQNKRADFSAFLLYKKYLQNIEINH